jgi:hypothetical protein
MMTEMKASDFDLKNNFIKLSVQNENCPSFTMNPKIMDIYKSKSENKGNKIKKDNLFKNKLSENYSFNEYNNTV